MSDPQPEPGQPQPMDDGTDRTGPAAEAEEAYVELTDTEWQDPGAPDTVPSGATLESDRRDAEADHDVDDTDPSAADDAPTGPVDPSVSQAEREAQWRGAHLEGEGAI